MQASEFVTQVKADGYPVFNVPIHGGGCRVLIYAPNTESVMEWLRTFDTARPSWDNVGECWEVVFPARWAK